MLRKFEILWIIFILATAVMIFSFSARDAKDSSEQSKVIANTIVSTIEKVTDKTIGEIGGKNDILIRGEVRAVVRKTAHFFEFMLFGSILFVALFLSRHEKKYLLTMGIGVFTASADEFIQIFSVGRKGLLTDVLIDSTGVAAGILTGVAILKLLRKLYVISE